MSLWGDDWCMTKNALKDDFPVEDDVKDTEGAVETSEVKAETPAKNRTKIFALAGAPTVVALGALTAGVIGANNSARATYTQEYNSAVQGRR